MIYQERKANGYIYIYIIKLYPELLVLLDNVFRRGMFVILSDLEKSS